MANYYINIYKGNPTADGTDGTAVSTDGTNTAPVSVTLDASTSASQVIPLAIRTESGFHTSGNTVISATGTNAGKWQFCLTENGTYASSVTISGSISNTNDIFYAKASSLNSEELAIDRSVSIRVQALVMANDTSN